MGIELYTYEDYIKDFESDYLGFADVLKEPVPEASSENNSEEKTKIQLILTISFFLCLVG